MSPVVLESTLNHDVIKLTQWFSVNHLQVNAAKTQAMTLGKSQFIYRFSVEDQIIDIEPTLKILGVTLDKDLNYKPHVDIMLKKAYAKIAALRKIKRLVPSNVMTALYKAYVLPNFEYCSPLLLGISRTLNNKLERANHYALRSILNLGNSVTYDACLSIASMTSLEQRRIEHSLIVFFQSFRMHGPNYISNFFKPRVTNYNLRGSGLNVSQPSYNNRFMHNSFSYFTAHVWNNLPLSTKSAPTVQHFKSLIKNVKYKACQCQSCIL